MPEITFRLRWPDGSETLNYSPSSIVKSHFEPGASYPLAEFLARARAAMQAASARVAEVHGYPCSRAQATAASIERCAAPFGGQGAVTVLEMSP